ECLVKFTTQYAEAAHRYLASDGYAPTLRQCIRISSEWIVVVMDWSKYKPLLEVKVRSKVKNVVNTLHEGGFVHGDVRDINILIDPKSLESDDVKVHLIDVDWAGRVGEAKYPIDINTKTMWRPDGVRCGELITEQHDN
ncbi:hypothetical protein BD410DRAFT_704093, partial [Rickenella mellea]